MNFAEAQDVYEKLLEVDPDLLLPRNDLFRAAVRYARLRADWALASREERREMDGPRTTAHDAFIDTCNILSRNMAQRGDDISWRRTLSDDRQEVGDFACHLACFLGLSAR